MKRAVFITGGVAGALILAVGVGRPLYRQARERHAITQAHAFLDRGDWTNALLCARQALAVNPTNPAACELMAGFAEWRRSPYALMWRKRLADVAPTLTNRLALAACALRFEAPPYAIAEKTLADLAPDAWSNAAYHLVASELAIKLRRFGDAEQHLLAATRLEPTNELHRVNLAVLRLGATDTNLAAQARRTLEQAAVHPRLGLPALRSLVADGLSRREWTIAERCAAALVARPDAVFADRLLHLSVLRAREAPDFAAHLQSAQALAATNPPAVGELVLWMNGAGLAAAAAAWVVSLPAEIRAQQPVPVALAECYARQENWKALQDAVENAQWGDLEPLRLAWLARALERQNERSAARLRWQSATRLVASHPVLSALLAQLAAGWDWTTETEELLWDIVERFPAEAWAAPALERFYHAQGNTRGLYKVCRALSDRRPADPVLKNNLAMYRLLLGVDTGTAHQQAREVYQLDPTNAAYASTYAFSQHRLGRDVEALRVMETLPTEALEEPATAAYYAIVLASAGRREEARRYIALAARASLLPEEKAMLEQAMKGE